MAKRSRRRPPRREEPVPRIEAGIDDLGGVPPGETTGRLLVLLKDDAGPAALRSMSRSAGLRLASASDFKEGPVDFASMAASEGVVFPDLGVAVVNAPPAELSMLAAAEDSDILAVEPERVVYAIDEAPLAGVSSALTGDHLDYLRGYRDAVNHLCDKLLVPDVEGAAAGLAVGNESELTWGLQATRAAASRFSGRGIRIAVLDTGLDLGHPDLTGRSITSQSFIQGQQVQDGNGHGTHCIGTACGPQRPGTLPRYGIAFESEIFAGKVLSNQGSGGDAGILAGIQWAITNRCAIVSMSLGASVQIGQSFSRVFEQAATRALAAGTVIIAAAGNASQRPRFIAPVSHPANCPSIMAVAAVDRSLRVASFSCGGLNPQGGQIDIAGPGVDVRSSWPRPTLYRSINGTSMATPHVAGIAALWAQSDARLRGRALMSMLTQSARRLALPARDIGSGLVQAP